MLEPLGDQIRIDSIRELRHDLHLRPFEADRRVYLIVGAHAKNEEAADALLKDLEEPPSYAVTVLVADELGSLPETIRSRCQPIPFRRLSEKTVRAAIEAQAPELPADEATAIARVAAGRLDRAALLLDDAAAKRRIERLRLARSTYLARAREAGARSRRGRPRGARADGAGDGAAAAPRRARRRARRVARGAGGNRCLVPRSRRLRGGRRDGSPLRPHRRAARGRLARAPRRRGAGGRARPRGLAQFCRVQRQCAVGAGGALRPPAPVVCGRKGRRLTLVVVTPVRPS